MDDDSARPLRTLCDRGLDGCRAGDPAVVEEVLVALIGMLNFDYERAALGLHRAYDGALVQARRGRLEAARDVLGRLREACAGSAREARGDG